ncbi:MAG: hypothetical protein V3V92_06635 [Candidatus Hydrothermarchaeales archaeon]
MEWWKTKQEGPKEEPKPEEPEAKPEPKEEPAIPVSRNDFDAMNQRIDSVMGLLVANQSKAPETKEEAPLNVPSIEDIAKAQEDGEYVKAAQMQESRNQGLLEKREVSYKKELEAVRDQSAASLGTLSEGIAQKELKYYKRFKPEIDAIMSNVSPTMRTLDAWKQAEKYVIGDHEEELFKEKLEQLARKKDTEEDLDVNNQSTRSKEKETPQITFGTVFGENFSNAQASWAGYGKLWDGHHRNPDEFAQNLGYENADQYAGVSQRIMSVEHCKHCYAPMIEVLEDKEHTCQFQNSRQKFINVRG